MCRNLVQWVGLIVDSLMIPFRGRHELLVLVMGVVAIEPTCDIWMDENTDHLVSDS